MKAGVQAQVRRDSVRELEKAIADVAKGPQIAFGPSDG
jgi:hypothetical protein